MYKKNYKEYLAKSSGETIFEHSEMVKNFALEIAKQMGVVDDVVFECVRYSAILHDVGKITENFQDHLTKGRKYTYKYMHNEIGWVVLSKYLKLPQNVLKHVLNSVYWHHGIMNKMGSYKNNTVLDKISENDVDNIVEYVKEVLGKDRVDENELEYSAPLYYYDGSDGTEKYNRINTMIRICLLSADKIVSSLTKNELKNVDIEKIVKEYSLKSEFKITKNPYQDVNPERFETQKEIAENKNNTIVVNATAGFGKTLVGVLWAMNNNKKLIWVCPRNDIATSVYSLVLKELKALGIDATVELYLTGEVKKSTSGTVDGFESDIIVTNIDNYLTPTLENSHISKFFLISNCNVIFDEYHELVSDVALYSCFTNLMMVRHRYTNSKTMLLSATGIKINHLWDSIGKKTTFLPEKYKHYNAVHQKKYMIKIVDKFLPIKGENNLVILNSIRNAQKAYQKLGCDLLIHSDFEKSKRNATMHKIYAQYGEKSNRNLGKDDVVSTHILQAGLDISFLNLFESVLSPEATLQRIGRIDRWGDYIQNPKINITKIIKNNSESSIKDILYSRNLSDLWYEYVEKLNNRKLTLDQLYIEYNNFSKINSDAIKKHLNTQHRKSIAQLTKHHTIKYPKPKSKNGVITAGSNRLRSTGNELFFIAQKVGSSEYSDAFNTKLWRNFDEDFKEKDMGNVFYKIKKIIKYLRNINDERFAYNDILDNKNITLYGLTQYARKENTPYIRFDVLYDPELGLVDNPKYR